MNQKNNVDTEHSAELPEAKKGEGEMAKTGQPYDGN